MIYLASPYTHPDPRVMESRDEQTCIAVGSLIKQGLHAYSPIAHSRSVALLSDLPHDFGFWNAYDTDMISRCDEVWVLMLDGWEDSEGVKAEIKIALDLNKKIRTLAPNETEPVAVDTRL